MPIKIGNKENALARALKQVNQKEPIEQKERQLKPWEKFAISFFACIGLGCVTVGLVGALTALITWMGK